MHRDREQILVLSQYGLWHQCYRWRIRLGCLAKDVSGRTRASVFRNVRQDDTYSWRHAQTVVGQPVDSEQLLVAGTSQ